MVQLLWKTVWWFPTKLHVHLSCDSKLSCQSTYLKEVKAETQTLNWTIKKLSTEELMLLHCGIGEDSWESLGLQGDPTSPS